MTPQLWNPDDATLTTGDEPELGRTSRYGVTGWESSHHEPLDLALAQEAPEPVIEVEVDERWAEVDIDDAFAGELVADDNVRDDDYALAVGADAEGFSAEELAMHVVEI
jgi:Family of unknown function (DUF5709)